MDETGYLPPPPPPPSKKKGKKKKWNWCARADLYFTTTTTTTTKAEAGNVLSTLRRNSSPMRKKPGKLLCTLPLADMSKPGQTSPVAFAPVASQALKCATQSVIVSRTVARSFSMPVPLSFQNHGQIAKYWSKSSNTTFP